MQHYSPTDEEHSKEQFFVLSVPDCMLLTLARTLLDKLGDLGGETTDDGITNVPMKGAFLNGPDNSPNILCFYIDNETWNKRDEEDDE